MEKRRRIEATQLPEEVIQHIQSFLSGREAAGTSILSRSWYTAWLTRPNLDFSELDIQMPGAFVRFVDKTMQRYDELKIKIQSFRLVMTDYKTDNNSLATRLIVKAMSLGATDLDINKSYFLLPHQVFGSSLIKLSLVGGRIDVLDQKVNCSRLKSLRLSRVCIEGNNIWDIISKCPLIEELVLSLCEGVYGNSTRSFRMLVLKPAAGLGVNDFLKLKVLSLETVEIGEWLFRDLSKLPCLKELTLHNCSGYKEIQICSNSLERMVFFQGNWKKMFMVKFDVPKIRKFKFTSSYVPSLSFKTCSSEWESDISFGCMMILKLREFLLELSSSKICLDLLINISVKKQYEYANHMIIGLPKPPMVEKLTLRMKNPSKVRLALLEDLFWSCRPKFMTIQADNYGGVKRLCNRMINEECENRNMSALHDLEEVDVQVGGRSAWKWSPFLPTNVLDASGWTGTEVCLQFKWG